MRNVMTAIGAASLGLLALAADPAPADATTVYPWCAHYNGRGYGGGANCGYTTFAQCLATVSGSQGTCEMNPWYEPQPQQQYPQRPRRRASQY